MKILHICLANFYIDNYSYQENLLPKYHKKMGLDVEIIASLVSFDPNGKPCILPEPNSYVNEYGIPVIRLAYKKGLLNRIFRRYQGLFLSLKSSKPDIIFVHGLQFLDIIKVKKYKNIFPNVKIYIDNHADFSNSAKNIISKYILHKIIWKYCARVIEQHVEKFYGVLPSRVDFLRDMYKIERKKTDLLVMGADDEYLENIQRDVVRKEIRHKHRISDDDLLILSGGKIDAFKVEVIDLIRSVKSLNNKNIKLILFGSIIEELKSKIKILVDDDLIMHVGWIDNENSYKYIIASDVVFFPGRHSVYWEQTVGIGVPLIVKKWIGMDHLNLGKNIIYMDLVTQSEISKILLSIYSSENTLKEMKKSAESQGKKNFLYSQIAKKSIEYNKEDKGEVYVNKIKEK